MTDVDPLAAVEAYLASVDLLDAPGAVLYSAAATVRPGPVYLLGLNPGGSGVETLRDSLAASRRGNNSYLDEAWEPGGYPQPKGQSTLQRRVQALCTAMGLNTRNVPASNLAFTRSTRLGTHLDYPEAMRRSAPAHRMLLDVIQPEFIMTFGAISHFRQAAELTSIEQRDAQHGSWKAHRGLVRWGDRKMRFGNIPHMSLWASDSRPEVIRWVIAGLQKV